MFFVALSTMILCFSNMGVWIFLGEKTSQACIHKEADPGTWDRNFQEHRHCPANCIALWCPLYICGEAGVCAASGGWTRYIILSCRCHHVYILQNHKSSSARFTGHNNAYLPYIEMVPLSLPLLPHSQKVLGLKWAVSQRHFCLEFACFPCASHNPKIDWCFWLPAPCKQ